MNRLGQHVARLLGRHVAERRVVVWYNPPERMGGCFCGFHTGAQAASGNSIGRVSHPDCRSGRFVLDTSMGPSLAFAFYPKKSPLEIPRTRLSYISPVRRRTRRTQSSWSLNWPASGGCPQLKRLAREVLKPFYVDGKIDELLDMAVLSYDDVVGWLDQAEEQAAGHGSMLKLVFPGFESSERLLAEWLVNDARDGAIEDKNAAPELRAHLSHRLGLVLPDATALADARNQCWRYLLVNEFRCDLLGPVPKSLSMLAAPSSDPQLKAVRQVLSTTRREHAAEYSAAPTRSSRNYRSAKPQCPRQNSGPLTRSGLKRGLCWRGATSC